MKKIVSVILLVGFLMPLLGQAKEIKRKIAQNETPASVDISVVASELVNPKVKPCLNQLYAALEKQDPVFDGASYENGTLVVKYFSQIKGSGRASDGGPYLLTITEKSCQFEAQ